VDLLDGQLRFAKNAIRPQRTVQAFLGHAQHRVSQRDRH